MSSYAEKTYSLLIEIGCEDLPPQAQSRLQESGGKIFENILKENRVKFSSVKFMTSPRRLAVKVSRMASRQKPEEEEVKGPPAAVAFKNGKPTKAGLGFARKMGVDFKRLQKKKTSRGEYYFFIREKPGRAVRDLLEKITLHFLKSLEPGEKMRWPGGALKFSRPLRWLTVNLGGRAVKFKLGNILSSSYTRGHYMFANKKIKVDGADSYEKVLERNYVIVDHRRRKEVLLRSLERPLKYTMGSLVKNEELLEEVNNSLEYPAGVKGSFDKKYLNLPGIIIQACLTHHQKYFPVEDSEGNLLNCFVAARDGISEYLDGIRQGYEKVLVARLEDADFFLKKDRQKTLQEHVGLLEGIEFSRGLGTLYDKVKRMENLSGHILEMAGFAKESREDVLSICRLCKADLATHIVNEFPELEGKAGAVYASMDGERKKVCEGIRQHLFPVDFKDSIPSLDEAAVVGVSDRLDTLAGNIAVGARASGSRDPYGLRRCCRGMLRIIIEKDWNIDLDWLIKKAVESYNSKKKILPSDARSGVREFVISILSQILHENFPHDTSRCVLADPGPLNPASAFKKAAAIEKTRSGKGFDTLVAAFKRINNILRQAEDKNIVFPEKYDGRRLCDDFEKKLGNLLKSSEKNVRKKLARSDFEGVLKDLISLKEPVDKFFDKVLVMDPREEVKKNRLALLKSILDLFSPAGDISKLELKNTDD